MGGMRGGMGRVGTRKLEVSILFRVTWDEPLGFANPNPFENGLDL